MAFWDIKRLRLYFEKDFNKDNITKIEYSKSTYLFVKIMFIVVILVATFICVHLFVYPNYADSQLQSKVDTIQSQLTKANETIKSLQVSDKKNQDDITLYKKKEDNYKQFESDISNVFMSGAFDTWKEHKVNVIILWKIISSTVWGMETLWKSVIWSPRWDLPIEVTKIDDTVISAQAKLENTSDSLFWEMVMLKQIIAKHKWSTATVNDLIQEVWTWTTTQSTKDNTWENNK